MRGCFLEPWCWAVLLGCLLGGLRLIDVWNEIVNRSRSRLILWECFLWIAWAVWWGGLSFYAILVVPIGTEQLGSVEQGFITQKVSLWHNGMTVLFVLCLAIDALDRNKRALWVVVSLLTMITFALIIAHSCSPGNWIFARKQHLQASTLNTQSTCGSRLRSGWWGCQYHFSFAQRNATLLQPLKAIIEHGGHVYKHAG